MRVLVTDGAGYIGPHTIIELHARGHEICVVDNFNNSSPAPLRRITEIIGNGFEHHQTDIRDRAKMDEIKANFHLTSCPSENPNTSNIAKVQKMLLGRKILQNGGK
ncbi:NAD-dependent epimerase/dehydratase family protein [Phaeobacter gallaeciensis]|uniref:NAD-dependent epimerase/dehydratase family protein n=1 Tax=Phaeobacter gallaeciensis TaxID=60890 RepID=UPI00237FD4D1|nr:NAD-dependent epimerase/dehydratase family protein [Phaeobacter gallaeciensis]MDE4142370.1 GDP-mannose 4,6-dehydratase [Phaeobacter gallaeciensis]MDE4150815.1 GDP-mannose 4,6-dehydratase [Phaeobacter gallaeciensis]MDE4155044.1 GDP-mannose 4,6-dehydratase [Phaeobacter gallaeciensis]MDE4230434.1 GDP-mannose 4,6-dehydratase [Phaeobacter gallaeciensis]MDE4259511.1 GDP-mannose 4,6-dehydratase [Phaeobacter gallaeciensis]